LRGDDDMARGADVADYHVLALDQAGDAVARTAFVAGSDELAISFAAEHCPHGCELWEADRFIAFLHKAWPKGRMWTWPGRSDASDAGETR
jgi:hypothetical protein